jgi:nucleoid DNA-binding protein
MSKLGNKELSSSLSDKHGLNKTDAEKFVSAFFDVINEGLASEKLVKIKGLGTFKIIGVAARKSVDVNTGAPIVIEGRDKISFTPDATLRDEINKPFSQFDTVVLNDGVDFTHIDKEFEEDPEAAVLKAIGETASTETASSEPASSDSASSEPASSDSASSEPASSDSASSEPASSDSASIETSVLATPACKEVVTNVPSSDEASDLNEKPAGAEPSLDDAKAEEPSVESNVVDESSIENHPNVAEKDDKVADRDTEEKVATEKKVEKVADQKKTEEEKIINEQKKAEEKVKVAETKLEEVYQRQFEENDVEEHQNRALKVLMVVAAIIVLGCIGGGYYLFKQIEKRDNHIERLEKQMKMVAHNQKNNTVAQTLPKAVVKPVDTLKTSPVPQTNAAQKKKTEKVDASKEDALQAEYNKDPRIRTGAYIITGIEKTITVSHGQTMSGISRTTLGLGMECYLEAVNGGKHELKAGDKIKIPSLKLKKKVLRK